MTIDIAALADDLKTTRPTRQQCLVCRALDGLDDNNAKAARGLLAEKDADGRNVYSGSFMAELFVRAGFKLGRNSVQAHRAGGHE